MLPVNGLYGHIRRNTLKSALLLAGFGALVAMYWYGLCLIYGGFSALFFDGAAGESVDGVFYLLSLEAYTRAISHWYYPAIALALWFTIAWLWHGALIRAVTRAHGVERRAEPELYNLVENLAIAAGLPMPRIEIMETDALNAYAAGLSPASATVAVTRGLLDTLNRDELEAVLAHEITHIKNRDIRLMVVALIFAGGITLLGDGVRSWWNGGEPGDVHIYGRSDTAGFGDLDGDTQNSGQAILGVLLAIAAAILLLAITHVSAILTRMAISRSREYMADAGAVELTKNPDALISALSKISGHDAVPLGTESLRAMMISSRFDDSDFVENLMATHPPIPDRIDSLVRYAGGRIAPRRSPRVRGGQASAAPAGVTASFAGGAPTFGRRRAGGIRPAGPGPGIARRA